MTLVATPVRIFIGLLLGAVAWAGCAGTLTDPDAFTDSGDVGRRARGRRLGTELPRHPDHVRDDLRDERLPRSHDEGRGARPRVPRRRAPVSSACRRWRASVSSSIRRIRRRASSTRSCSRHLPSGRGCRRAAPSTRPRSQCVLDWATSEAGTASSGTDGGTQQGFDAGAGGGGGCRRRGERLAVLGAPRGRGADVLRDGRTGSTRGAPTRTTPGEPPPSRPRR